MHEGAIEQPAAQEQERQSEADALRNGSVHVALALPRPFGRYLFIEHKASYVAALNRLVRSEFPHLQDRCQIERADANEFLQQWCDQQDWRRTRAVVFLDPYGMAVDWTTVEKLGRTGAVDLWTLLPVGMGINRVLTNAGLPTTDWGMKLSRFFGTSEWVKRFYAQMQSNTLFGTTQRTGKIATVKAISEYYNERLRTVFPYVAPSPGVLMNSKNSLMFMLHFASHNANGLKIANHILTR
jgi:three-Cys-motif partner protein